MLTRQARGALAATAALPAAVLLLLGADPGGSAWGTSGTTTQGIAAGRVRLLVTSDWSGTSRTYAFDPTARLPVGQLTFGDSPCVVDGRACAFGGVAPSPDGRWLVFKLASRPEECPYESYDVSWAPDSRRIAYQISAPGRSRGQIRIATVSGSNDRPVASGIAPLWSPSGDAIAFLRSALTAGEQSQLIVYREGSERTVARSKRMSSFSWSPDGKWLSFDHGSSLFVVRPDGTGRRKLVDEATHSEAWSADSRFVSFSTGFSDDVVKVVEVASGALRAVDGREGRYDADWSPRGHLLAIGSETALSVFDAATGAARAIVPDPTYAVSWAPDGRSLAYTVRLGDELFGWYQVGDVRVTDLAGRARTVVAARGSFGGGGGLTWTMPPAGTRYRTPQRRTIATLTPDGLKALWPIDHIAADGDRVAFSACGHAFVWAPTARSVVQADPSTSLTSRCTSYGYAAYTFYGLAIAGDRLLYGARNPSANGAAWEVVTQSLALDDRVRTVATGGGAGNEVDKGEPVGSGDLLVFGSWECGKGYCPQSGARVVATQSIWRLREPTWDGACPTVFRGVAPGPCQRLLTQPGLIVPFDVDARRVVAGGANETWILDPDGRVLRSIPLSPLAAQLSGDDLVLVRRGELLHYRASSGTLVRSWPLPNVSSGRECGSYGTVSCPYEKPALILEDAARGLIAYTLGGEIRVLRLADGDDALVARGTLARFVDAGLVVARGAELRLIRDEELP